MQLRDRLKEHDTLLKSILSKSDMAQRNTDLAGFTRDRAGGPELYADSSWRLMTGASPS